MASFLFHQYLPISLFLLLLPLLISSAHSLKCTSQKFAGSTHYENCTDLASLNAYLHWTYVSTNKTLSIAFIAPPPKSGGWVAWAINPTGTGMAGAQALLAHKASNGSMVVNTYNISSYSSIVPSTLWFDVLDKKAEFSDGVIRIFAALALPKNLTTVNQVWQVGPLGTDGNPEKHEFKPDNLNAKGPLQLVKDAGKISPVSPAPSPSPGTSGPSGNGSGKDTGGCGRTWNKGFLSFYGHFLLLGILVLGF